MSKRAASVEDTRRRIVEATMELHGERGIPATSWEDIAERAGVAPATVYRHYPTLDELLPACGSRSFEQLEFPTAEEARAWLDGAEGVEERVSRMVDRLFDLYERGAVLFAEIVRTRARFDVVADYDRELSDLVDVVVAEALRPLGTGARESRVVRALMSFESFSALVEQGLHGRAVRTAGAQLVTAFLAQRRQI